MTSLTDRLKLRHKLAALSVVGVAMCVLPLWQVLRFQTSEIDRSRTAEYGPDPAVLAVAVQRALLGHRDAAHQVLRGQQALEPERRELQIQVDLRLVELNHGVQQRATQPAVQETAAMRADWLQLAGRVLKRSLTADASDAAHRLLVEQTLQVIDLVADTSGLMRDPDPTIARLAQTLVRPMARLSVALISTPADGSAPASPTPGHSVARHTMAPTLPATAAAPGAALLPDLRLAAADADRALLTLELPAVDGMASAQAVADAAAASRKAVQEHLRLLRDSQATPERVAASRATALQAHTAVLSLLQAELKQRLKARVTTLEEQRLWLGGVLAALGLVALWITSGVLNAARALERAASPQGLAGVADAGSDGQSPLRDAMRWLLQRVRGPAPRATAQEQAQQPDKATETQREP